MAMEVKMYYRKKKRGKTHQIDHIPKCFQLPRSASTSKPRTQFFLPICCSKEMEPRSSKEIQSSVTVGSSDMSNDTTRRTIDPFFAKSFDKKTHVQPCSNRNDALELTSDNSLKQALCYKEHPRSCKDSSGSPDPVNHHERDNSSSSGRTRSKRERKPKVHFDEVSCPLYTSRKVRRFKIMRFLGLAAPVGSPFNSS